MKNKTNGVKMEIRMYLFVTKPYNKLLQNCATVVFRILNYSIYYEKCFPILRNY
jgi:hypothetical protein